MRLATGMLANCALAQASNFFQLLGIGRRVGLVSRGAFRVHAGQACGDVFHVQHHVLGVLPGVRVGFVVTVAVTGLLHLARWHAGGCDHGDALVASRFGQFLRPGFEVEAIDDKQARVQYRPGVARAGCECMRVGIRPGQRGELDALATHHLNQVAQDAEGSHHGNRLGGYGPVEKERRCSQCGQGQKFQGVAFHRSPCL